MGRAGLPAVLGAELVYGAERSSPGQPPSVGLANEADASMACERACELACDAFCTERRVLDRLPLATGTSGRGAAGTAFASTGSSAPKSRQLERNDHALWLLRSP